MFCTISGLYLIIHLSNYIYLTISLTTPIHQYIHTIARAARKEPTASRMNSFKSYSSEVSRSNSFDSDPSGECDATTDASVPSVRLGLRLGLGIDEPVDVLDAVDVGEEEGECEDENGEVIPKEEDEDGGTSRITLQNRIDFLIRKMKRGRGGRGAGKNKHIMVVYMII